VRFIKKRHNVIVGERTAEDIKINIGCVYPKNTEEKNQMYGDHILDNDALYDNPQGKQQTPKETTQQTEYLVLVQEKGTEEAAKPQHSK
ncbi:MAG: hypothetical protein EOM15_08910, partial [Spirochaetia bacterium]|nr:hypothetical protein [Spirochaetia bacterium]